MDARKRINQNRKKQVGGGGGAGGSKRKGVSAGKNRSAGVGSARKTAVSRGRKPGGGQKTAPVKPKHTIKRTVTGLKLVTANKKTKPISDLRQLITQPKTTPKAKQTGIKKRLGLQSSSAKERARLQQQPKARTARMDEEVIVIRKGVATTGRSVVASSSGGGNNRVWRRSDQSGVRVISSQPQIPTVVYAQAPSSSGSFVSSGGGGGRQSGHSIIVSNLNPSVTQNDIIELFGDVGGISSYQSINSTTAMVTYGHPADAQRAIQTYNNRFLDGLPMQVTLIPTPTVASTSASAGGSRTQSSQVFRRVYVQ